jgi:hypothetical protein
MVTNPCRGLFHRPREMRDCSGGCHEESQYVHAPGIRQEFDISKRMNGLPLFSSRLSFSLIVSVNVDEANVKRIIYLTALPYHVIFLKQFTVLIQRG